MSQMLKALVWLACASAGAEASRFRGLPEPYGHTAQISPHNPNSDREWYTEYRWTDGAKYKPQDGPITTQPKHAPIPKHTAEEKTEQWGKPLNKKPEQSSASSSNSTKTGAVAADTAPSADKGKAKGGSNSSNSTIIKSSAPTNATSKGTNGTDLNPVKGSVGPGNATWEKAEPKEPSYAVAKPCGHTSQVHPYHGNRDREWYTEYRWKPGTEYKPQDGSITEKPKPAMRGITANAVGEPCTPIAA
eukprot:gnl/MRDRNA2_/MRDRNA2_51708_c0_seq1.p1 gnl/MRDRNA2_/MRDRNA2_51708_c0~~gnl/MRDRNA2_/MRDRNA2_51708_c0_seq1.p1  ORF type:complete len:246 (+),score=48.25 gnl/MRDRNA2_/MRDRNA2_51708_c0_seq1:79-816(+)